MPLHKAKYNDIINEEIIEFFTDASQDFVTSLEFTGEWYHAKQILESCDYKVIERIEGCFN